MIGPNAVKEDQMGGIMVSKTTSDSTNTSENGDDEEEERLKKQREDKRRFRARQKSSLLAMRAQLKELENQYQRLYVGNMPKKQQVRSSSPSSMTLSARYRQTRIEVERLRSQNAMMKKELVKRERFASLLDGYRLEFELPDARSFFLFEQEGLTKPDGIFAPLSFEECRRIVCESYQAIFHPRIPKGRRVSSGARVFGWSDERLIDGTMLHYSLEKTYAFVTARHFMEQTWAMLTQVSQIHYLHPSGRMQVLQVVSDDMIVVRRSVHYPSLDIDVMIDMLVFRLQTDKGYLVAYRSIEPRWRRAKSLSSATQVEFEAPQKVISHDTLVWQRLDDEELVETNTVMVNDSEIPSFYPQGASQCRVTCGGRIDTRDSDVVKFLIVEVVFTVIRWDQAVAGSKLCWGTHTSDANRAREREPPCED